ncbi:MAG TPA: YXWGXW repeat-containing protein [Polyangiales bacterium]
MHVQFHKQHKQLGAHTWRTARARAGLTITLLVAAVSGGCASTQRTEVAGVAAIDLACDAVDVSELSSGNYAASGCGRGAVYAQLCDYNGCRWGRLRHGHEQQVAASMMPPPPTAGREILPAPPPEQRVVLPAPAPDGNGAPPAPPPPGAAPAPDPNVAQPLQDSSLVPGAAPYDPNLGPTPLSAGVLSDPYQTEVPPQPMAQSVLYPPPAPLVEVPPPAPVRTHVWIGGYWWWGPSNWVWVPGYWCPPYHGYAYVPGRWSFSAGYWRYGPGGWARPGSTVIVHNHFPPRPSTVASVRAFTPRRVVSVGPVANSRVLTPARVAPSNYAPRSSPLYPSSNKRTVQTAPAGGYRYDSGRTLGASPSYRSGGYSGGSSVGRVVTPDSAVRTPSGYTERRSAPSTYRSPSYDTRSSGRSFDSGGGRSYSGGSSRSSGGGWSSGGGGGGGRMAPVRVSPGGGGGRGR